MDEMLITNETLDEYFKLLDRYNAPIDDDTFWCITTDEVIEQIRTVLEMGD